MNKGKWKTYLGQRVSSSDKVPQRTKSFLLSLFIESDLYLKPGIGCLAKLSVVNI